MLQIKQFVFHGASTAAGTGEEMENDQGGTLTIVCPSFNGTAKVQGKLDGKWNDIAVINCANAEPQESITGGGAYSVLCVDGFEKIRVNLTAINTGSEFRAVGRLCY